MRLKTAFIICFVILFTASTAMAVPTNITVRVRAKDSKFIGTSVGGALVTIKDADTGKILAEGITVGTTGNTERIMITPAKRGVPLSDETSAKFTATIDINEPIHIEVRAYGPLSLRKSANTVSVTQLVFPGKHIISGDALMLELPGLIVDVVNPPGTVFIPEKNRVTLVEIQANVFML